MSDSDGSDSDLPSAEECDKRCHAFADVTGTDVALAMFYLQDRAWDLERAVNAYLEENGPPEKAKGGAEGASNDVPKECKEDRMPNRIRLLSWNIDGLDTTNIKTRTAGVCKNILQDDPDVVFLQEVVATTVEIIENLCPQYHVISSKDQSGYDYFCAMLLKSSTVEYQEHSVIQFFSSKMGRNLLKVQAKVKGIETLLMTSHLESTKPHAAERKRQLTRCFQEMKEASGDRTVIFGGDLNARDQEVQEAGGVPEGILDLWEVTGKRPEARYTWDLTKNDNLMLDGKFRPKCRFDRLYIRHCEPKARLKPVYFELAGIQRLPKCQRFCSDHWGILTHYDKI